MLDSIRKFFREHMATDPAADAAAAAARARLAAAALLVEVVRSDHHFSEVEREAVMAAAGRKFRLDAAQARALVELAEAEAKEAHDLYQFTSLVNAGFSPEQKVRLVEELWRVAWSDDVLHHYEEHVIRKVADLIHVPHSAYIAAKLRVQDARPR
ncbi:MAG: hypothetical protein H6R27_940 [Proteobacteria bacterium]|nr:hypothetical protein [Pseudomonadota bacterium]